MKPNWTSYNSAAGCHDSVTGPKMFVRPAADLVARLDVRNAGTILDVGTGSGIAARAAQDAAPEAFVTGVDPSFEMLRAARGRGLAHVAVAAAPGLPFADDTFHRVMASFVLSHVADYESALADMVRVLGPGGRLGITAWGAKQNDYRELWDSLSAQRMGKERMDEATRAGLPWEDWLTDERHVRESLAAAGLSRVEVERTEYDTHMSLAEFLSTREKSLTARFMKASLEPGEWESFFQNVVAEFERRFEEQILFTRDVLIGTGRQSG
jgi:ubiquinone/menaquinone biosynthesis C-methylase UbiE